MNDSLGAYLRRERELRGLSQAALAARCRELRADVVGISARSIGFWEHGSRKPSVTQFAVWAAALDMSPQHLLEAVHRARLPEASAA